MRCSAKKLNAAVVRTGGPLLFQRRDICLEEGVADGIPAEAHAATAPGHAPLCVLVGFVYETCLVWPNFLNRALSTVARDAAARWSTDIIRAVLVCDLRLRPLHIGDGLDYTESRLTDQSSGNELVALCGWVSFCQNDVF